MHPFLPAENFLPSREGIHPPAPISLPTGSQRNVPGYLGPIWAEEAAAGGGAGRVCVFVPVLVLVPVLVCRWVCDVIVMGDGMGNGMKWKGTETDQVMPSPGLLPAMVD